LQQQQQQQQQQQERLERDRHCRAYSPSTQSCFIAAESIRMLFRSLKQEVENSMPCAV
jgi:hypothetical protein